MIMDYVGIYPIVYVKISGIEFPDDINIYTVYIYIHTIICNA